MALLNAAHCLANVRAILEDKLASFPNDGEYIALAEAAGMTLPREDEPHGGDE